MKKIFIAITIATSVLLTGCSLPKPSVSIDPYSGKQVLNSDVFYMLTPVSYTETDRVVFSYRYNGGDDFILDAGYITSAQALTGMREGIVNIGDVNFMIDGVEYSLSSQSSTNYKGMRTCNEIRVCSKADGSFKSYKSPLSLMDKIQSANKVMVKIIIDNSSYKVGILKDNSKKSDAYDALVNFHKEIKANSK